MATRSNPFVIFGPPWVLGVASSDPSSAPGGGRLLPFAASRPTNKALCFPSAGGTQFPVPAPMSAHYAGTLEELIREAKAGSAEALGELLEVFRRPLLRVANARLRQEWQAEIGGSDFVQDALVRAYRSFTSFAGTTPAELQVWLQRILCHEVDHFARQYTRKALRAGDVTPGTSFSRPVETQEEAERSSPPSILIREEEAHRLHCCLSHLSRRDREICQLRFQRKMSYPEIARVMGCSSDAVRQACYRALRTLAKELT